MVDTKLYGWVMPEQPLRREKNTFLLLSLLNAALSIACGVIATGVTRHNWVSPDDGGHWRGTLPDIEEHAGQARL